MTPETLTRAEAHRKLLALGMPADVATDYLDHEPPFTARSSLSLANPGAWPILEAYQRHCKSKATTDPLDTVPPEERERIVAVAQKDRVESGYVSSAPWAGRHIYDHAVAREVAAYHAEPLTREGAEEQLRAIEPPFSEGDIAKILKDPRATIAEASPEKDIPPQARETSRAVLAILRAYVRGLNASEGIVERAIRLDREATDRACRPDLTPAEEAEIIASAPGQIGPGQTPIGRPPSTIAAAFEAMLAFFICLIGPRPHRKITPAEEIGALAACEVETDFTPDSPPTDLERLRALVQEAAEEHARGPVPPGLAEYEAHLAASMTPAQKASAEQWAEGARAAPIVPEFSPAERLEIQEIGTGRALTEAIDRAEAERRLAIVGELPKRIKRMLDNPQATLVEWLESIAPREPAYNATTGEIIGILKAHCRHLAGIAPISTEAAAPVTDSDLAEIEARTSGPGPLAGDGDLLRRCRAEIVALRGERNALQRSEGACVREALETVGALKAEIASLRARPTSRPDLVKLRALYDAATVGLLIETGNGAITEADESARALRDPHLWEPLAIVAGNLDLDKAAALARLLVEAHNALPALIDELARWTAPIDVDTEVESEAREVESRYVAICERLGNMSSSRWPYVVLPHVEREAHLRREVERLTRELAGVRASYQARETEWREGRVVLDPSERSPADASLEARAPTINRRAWLALHTFETTDSWLAVVRAVDASRPAPGLSWSTAVQIAMALAPDGDVTEQARAVQRIAGERQGLTEEEAREMAREAILGTNGGCAIVDRVAAYLLRASRGAPTPASALPIDRPGVRDTLRALAVAMCATQARDPEQKAQLQRIAEAHDALRYALGDKYPAAENVLPPVRSPGHVLIPRAVLESLVDATERAHGVHKAREAAERALSLDAIRYEPARTDPEAARRLAERHFLIIGPALGEVIGCTSSRGMPSPREVGEPGATFREVSKEACPLCAVVGGGQ